MLVWALVPLTLAAGSPRLAWWCSAVASDAVHRVAMEESAARPLSNHHWSATDVEDQPLVQQSTTVPCQRAWLVAALKLNRKAPSVRAGSLAGLQAIPIRDMAANMTASQCTLIARQTAPRSLSGRDVLAALVRWQV
jgi:hypothetical protein